MSITFAKLSIIAISLLIYSCSSTSSQNNRHNGNTSDESTLPAKGVEFHDAEFGTTVVRVSDKEADGYSGPGIENEYARSDPESSDGKYFILRGNDGTWYLYDAETYKMLRDVSSIASGGEEPEPRWDLNHPNIFYYLSGTKLMSYDVDSKESATVHNFKNEFPGAAYITTKTEGDASLDRRYWCFMVEDEAYGLLAVATYDKSSNSILGQKTSGFPDGINWVSMDMSGEHCVIGYEDSDDDGDDVTPPAGVFSRSMSLVTTLPEGSTGHMDLALTSGGRDVMVYQNNATDWIAMADLKTGEETNLLKIPFDVNPDIGLHFSGNCSDGGWVLVSTYGSKNPPEGSEHSWMDNELFMLELKAPDDDPYDEIANTNSYTSVEYEGEKNYFAESFAAVNSGCTKVYFGSNWGIMDVDYTDAYIAEMGDLFN